MSARRRYRYVSLSLVARVALDFNVQTSQALLPPGRTGTLMGNLADTRLGGMSHMFVLAVTLLVFQLADDWGLLGRRPSSANSRSAARRIGWMRVRRSHSSSGSDDREYAIGRKNHFGSRSKRGTEVAALFYSLLETAKLTGINLAAYLAEATRRAIANPGTVTLPPTILTETT
ncbi:MAG: hypothetical protein ACI9OJ_003569 [Myxococcota bacterium]|jgi:hypothetical protein